MSRDPKGGLHAQKRTLGAVERDEVQRRTSHWIAWTIDLTRLVFVDESGTTITLVLRYGRASSGERRVGSVPRNERKNLVLLASLLFNGAADGAAFQVYVEQVLFLSLTPGQAVILDNLSIHKQGAICESIRRPGVVLFLLNYSSDFNPIWVFMPVNPQTALIPSTYVFTPAL